MKKIILTISAFVFFAMISCSYSCQFDSDCAYGSTCLMKQGRTYGVCVGGHNPGNENDQNAIPQSDNYNNNNDPDYGVTCQFNSDCGDNGVCVIQQGETQGACMNNNNNDV